jgi:two-component system C4-dicarboxylate transport sensor histidine kinase DctB
MQATPRPLRITLIVLLIVVGAVLSGFCAMRHAQRITLAEQAARGAEPLGLYANALHTLIERYRALPGVLALDPELIQALASPPSGQTRHALNLKLERINGAARSSTLELLDREGVAIAASNWRSANSYVGQNYGFRPYFKQAISHGSGRFYAVGVTSGIPGYFLSQAVVDERGHFLGAMVVKLEFPELEQEWSQGPDTLLVSDARGIIFIANQPGWRYRELYPLNDSDLAELAATRQYDKQVRHPLQHASLQHFGERSDLVRVTGPQGERDYLWDSQPMPDERWTLHLLRQPLAGAEESRNAALAAAGVWLSLALGILLLNQRLRLSRLRRRSREELEQLVQARTAQLRTAQEGLVQSAKLAALGQMSAALAHEINQPLTTQRMQLATLRLLLDHGRIDDAYQALQPLEQMLARMAALTGHLKTFARKSPAGLREPLDLAQVVGQALQLLEPRLREEQVQLDVQLARPALMRGDAIRLEQVLINLLHNALDAMRDKPLRRLAIELHAQPGGWLLHVDDTGGGIATANLSHVFDPFFTTKPVGEGLGLGLAVSLAIIHEHGGTLLASNYGQGARFALTLPTDAEPA